MAAGQNKHYEARGDSTYSTVGAGQKPTLYEEDLSSIHTK
jgi:hypothetical protein